ncbi:MAG: hypothetical protein ACRENE_10320 [Polyangiaceae bacterium]
MRRTTLAASLTAVVGIAGSMALAGACSQSAGGSTEVGAGVGSILFIKRQTTTSVGGQVMVDVAGGNGQVLDYQRYVPGGSLNLLSPARADGNLINLTSAYPHADFNGADVSFDASQAVFSMKTDGNSYYHLYTVQLSPGSDGKYTVHQLTNGPQDDINPIYASGGLVAFVTNENYTAMGRRADEYEHAREALQLATITLASGDASRHFFPQNLSHTVAPFLRSDGRIGFSQWEHFAMVNDVKIRAADPDGTQIVAVAGQHGKPGDALFTVREISPNVMIGIVTARDRTIHSGALVQIDARNHKDPVCLDAHNYQTGKVYGHQCVDEENVTYKVLTPDVPTDSTASAVGRYREPSVLPDGRILTSWAAGPVSDVSEQSLTPPDFGIYVFDPATGQNQLVYNDRATWDLNAVPVVARAEPVFIGQNKIVQDSTHPATIGSVDIKQTSLDEVVSGAEFDNVALSTALGGATAVRVIEGFSSEAAPGVTMFGLTMFEGAAVLGEAPVYADGSWEVNVPPYLPMHLQPIDKFGLSIRNQQLWIQAQPEESRRCVGCHESRTGTGVPAMGQNPTVADAQLLTQTPFTEPIAQRGEYGWSKVQTVLDAHCTKCHNDQNPGGYYGVTKTDPVSGAVTTYQIPKLDFSSTPITVAYDKGVYTWPISYVSIFYPATVGMGMTKGITLTGAAQPCTTGGLSANMPAGCTPWWGVPGSARGSALTEKVNLHGVVNGAADGSTAWPVSTHPFHPEDVGETLTDTERATLAIYPMDLGGQYYSRQNTGFVQMTTDPVTPTP